MACRRLGSSPRPCSRNLGVPHQALSERSGGRQLQESIENPCAKSWLGYQCTFPACGKIRIHWSLGGDPPSGPGCSYLQNTAQSVAAPDPSSQLLHVALQSAATGYLAMSWPRTTGYMYPADAIIGFLDSSGQPSVGAYRVLSYYGSDVQRDGSVDVIHTGLEVNATTLTICFTRNISQVGPAAGIRIGTQTPVGMNFVASSNAFNGAHRLGSDYACGTSLTLYQPVVKPTDNGWRPSNEVLGDDEVMAERLRYMRLHGALQFTGWIVLVPLGILAARHRWFFAPAGVVGLWFQVHRAVQLLAVVLITAGFVLPWTSFDSYDEEQIIGSEHEASMGSDMLVETHERLAIALMTALGLHIFVAVLRPKPDAPRRGLWNLVHWWTGRGLAALAGVNVAIGIALWRRASGGSGAEWIIPGVLFAAGWVCLAVWMERRAPEGLGREGGSQGGSGVALTAGYVSTSSSPDASSPAGGMPLSRLSGIQTQVSNGVQYTKLPV
ncbi:hypothetical protein PLESTF_000552500 [Pleodorina starrii]|nr:hypothetical protein PLESTM_001608000 [Pleodorina starrii]GLC67404.1 hypothetical protein PLESTF_000552500 [Pleodorina starrii]